jgi:L-rhamnose isomerase
MNYCEKCYHISEGEVCAECGNGAVRTVLPDDMCFFTICDERMGEMLRDALEQDGIKVALVPFGSGVRSAFGMTLGSFEVYVPYCHRDDAQNFLDTAIYGPSEELRKVLMDNRDKWHIASKKVPKRLCKKFKLDADTDILLFAEDAVNRAASIKDDGFSATCGSSSGNYITVDLDGKVFWFNSMTYEIFI